MKAIKETSTFQFNKKNVFKLCPVTFVMEKIGNYWKPIILFHLLSGTKRYSELKKAMPHITEKMLAQHLKQLEGDELVLRKSMNVVPPHVTYSLTPAGQGLTPRVDGYGQLGYNRGAKNGRTAFQRYFQIPWLMRF